MDATLLSYFNKLHQSLDEEVNKNKISEDNKIKILEEEKIKFPNFFVEKKEAKPIPITIIANELKKNEKYFKIINQSYELYKYFSQFEHFSVKTPELTENFSEDVFFVLFHKSTWCINYGLLTILNIINIPELQYKLLSLSQDFK